MKIIFVYKKINKNKSLNHSHSQRMNNYLVMYMIHRRIMDLYNIKKIKKMNRIFKLFYQKKIKSK
jgi:hypothetical protein